MQLRSISAAALAALAFAALPALAVDGVVLIDQNKALAGNVTPGDAAGFPVTLSRPGSYRLSGNLTAPAGVHGFVIASPGVTLDLNGFTLSSDGPAGTVFPYGVTDGSAAGTLINQPRAQIRNGHIAGFTAAVNMSGSEGVVVEGLRVEFPFTSGLTILVGPYSLVQRNVVLGRGAIRSVCPSVVTENVTPYFISHSADYSRGYCLEYHNRGSNSPHDTAIAE
jgi:hypothetical protein